MSSQELDEERIFHLARSIPGLGPRNDYLEQICAGDQALRERVEALLEVHEQEQSFLKSARPSDIEDTRDHSPVMERPGTVIGRYKLMEQIGEGGMGTVFVAQQDRPIRQKVALKVIKPGMDSKAVIARFEAERQALALMDHPNIAKVLDAGTTDAGRPYFAMELIKGVPITEYCNRNRLTVQERLELFIPVCQAIQHAHHKGIIHRDIKPSNVLVTLHDNKPVPKVIDFGVAKSLNARLTDRTIYTEHLQVVGTLLYMPPEQAELNGLGVDTRSDVYSLGVLLYELLTGTTPFQKADLERAGLEEQRRIIRDQDPPRASERISSLGETATVVAQQRKTDPKHLNQAVRGDLDWIVHKALEKDRTRRYEDARDFADDVRNYLVHEPVNARPPTICYRTTKYLRRNRIAIGVVSLLLVSLSVGMAGTLFQKIRADSSLRELQNTAVRAGFDAALAGDIDRTKQLAELASKAHAEPDTVAAIRALSHLFNGDPETAIESIEVRSGYERSLALSSALAIAYMWKGDISESRRLRKSLENLPARDDYDRCLQTIAVLNEWDGGQRRSQVLDDVVARNGNWLMARFFRANHLRKVAQDAGDLQVAVEATKDASIASPALRGTKLGPVIPVLCYHVAYLLALKNNDPQAVQWKRDCEEAIGDLPDDMLQMAGWHHDDADEVDVAIGYWRKWNSANDQRSSVRRCGYISCLLRAGKQQEAIEALRYDPQVKDDWSKLNNAMIIVDRMKLNAGDAELVALCDSLLGKQSIQPQARSMLLALMELEGTHRAEVSKMASRWYADIEIEAGKFERQIWRYYSEADVSGTNLVSAAQDSRCDRARSEFYIAMRYLALKNIEETKRHLRACSEAAAYQYIETPWARMLLNKINRDGGQPKPQ